MKLFCLVVFFQSFCSFFMDILLLYWPSVILIIPLTLFYFQWRRTKAPAIPLPLPPPPGPSAWHIVGNIFQLAKRPHESLSAFSLKYGPLMSFRLGMKTIVVASSPAMAKEVLKTHDHIFVDRTIVEAAKVFSHHKFSLAWGEYGPHWKYLRRISNVELFSPQRLEAQHLRRDQVFHTVRLIFERKGKSVNIEHMAFCNSMNVLGNMIFGRSLINPYDLASVGLKDSLWKIMKLFGTANLSDFYPLVSLVDPQSVSRQTAKHLKRLYDFIDFLIQDRIVTRNRKHMKQNHSDKDFLDVLLDTRTEDFTLFDVRALISELFLGGTDSTTTMIEWVMAELIRNPQKMKRVQQELDDVVGLERKVEEYDIGRFPYLDAVLKETFRLHPAFPLLAPHRAREDCEIEGYMVPKHSQVIVNLWAIGRDPSIWTEPLEFMPERFLEGENSAVDYRGHNFELIPFGSGRRLCVGLPFGVRMLHLVLACFLHSFEWTLPRGMTCEQMDMRDEIGLVLKKAVELNAIPKPRLPHHVY